MTDPVLDFAALLAPIPGDDPAGRTVPYPLRQKLRAARKETEPHPDDPSLPDVPRKVDWRGLMRLCQDTLTATSKDLEVALQLLEAATRVHDFAGIRDGLHVLHGLVTECWDRLHPMPEGGEGFEDRAERFHWITEADRGALFPLTIKGLPLVQFANQKYSLQDRQLALEGRGPLPSSDFERSEALPNVADDLEQSLAELSRLEQALQEQLADNAPGLSGLRQALEECNTFMRMVLRSRGGDAPAAADEQPVANGAPPRAGVRTGNMVTREDAYRQLAQVADFLEHLEPHSPIPDLLRRAIELGKMPFRQLVRELVRDTGQLAEVRREFGIKEGETS